MLRRFLSGFLLLIFLFNLGGYYVMFSALSLKANRELSARLDVGQYDEQETITIDIPFALPYPIQGSDFERYHQDFAIGDNHYQVVKQKFENDVLTIVCIRDHKNDELEEALRTMDPQQSDADGPVSLSVKSVQEYVNFSMASVFGSIGWSHEIGRVDHSCAECVVHLDRVHGPPRA